ncbi:DUF3408 domain-containing protein [Bacteroides xylanisolvens]|uniref:DUF3408 domain-containing protein n=1 Tax=Bacteroides xylanisolvens TaxID=371601 RepID=UPI0018985063|nr:DUF3408 domain-containing protein [Bacteroides xylanisolvens]
MRKKKEISEEELMLAMGTGTPSSKSRTEVPEATVAETTAPIFDESAVPEAERGQPEEPSSIAGQPPEPAVQHRISGRQRRLSLEEYRGTFMRPYKIEDRKPVFISRKLRDTLDRFACKIGENRMNLSGLLENIVRHHVELYAEDFEHWKKL